jgi:sialic acid synthase
MREFTFGRSRVSQAGPCYVIAEIGHNHQGSMDQAVRMIQVAATMGANAVKLQKRDNRRLFTRAMYSKPYENENSFGSTYGQHREALEFGTEQYRALQRCADEHGVEFLATAFDEGSVDFLEELGVAAYKTASGDVTNTPLLEYIARLGKPMFVSTGAASLDEVRLAYRAITKHHDAVCLLHCTAGYPTEYEKLNLRAIVTLKEEFPHAVIGYSGHDTGILAPSVAYMLGATVVEKHFTLNRAWKGNDHKFSLEPTGLQKMVRDLRRIDIVMGSGVKAVQDFEWDARVKMGKSLYAARELPAGAVLRREDITLKSPGGGVPPYRLGEFVGKRLRRAVGEEEALADDHLDDERRPGAPNAP